MRSHIVSKLFALFLGLAFLNMSFFLSEIRMLNLELDRGLIENIAKMIFNVGVEEERDAGEDIPEEGKGKKAVDAFLYSGRSAAYASVLTLKNRKARADSGDLPRGCVEIVTPPPKS